ncbi:MULTISPECIES: hypothetical protein [Paraburkholderia]|uniref:Uncharacterized protein n=1 Tax=Paraburkholderia madseniana TaxID=2599607 RepID=A0AAP5BHU3_9BURK|nr:MULTISPECIES: hypothetical protein [Paraburkholderia]MCX4150010.1 hypothetical protein [Paraburkholderia madseniana]MCX4177798.1 hypothetical protein [Paraburkholderia madseniana]MDN7152946.1 hypothetical protein [Paraburkholderia sp. WS6]MDQ6411828.1 hypothetical protein [Paraburkholderia madseniana]MDQ6465785.1 hypothetical protein [Paraburkholderia madseniana]
MSRREPKHEVTAYAYVKQESCTTELIVDVERAVVGPTGYVYSGSISLRAFVSDQSAESFAHRVTFSNICGAETDEVRVALRKLDRIRTQMIKADRELGDARTFAEFARRAMLAARVSTVYVARDAAGRPRNAAHYIVANPADGRDVHDSIGRLEMIALTLYGKRVEAA